MLFRFLQVGAVGFAVDAGLLWMLVYALDFSPILARAISFFVTILVTFALNASHTFRVPRQSASMPRYIVIQCLGASLNFLSYSWLVLASPIAGRPLVALAIGSAIASTHNYLMMRRYVFRAPRSEQ